jgi:TRAP-type C4-dicarboxylate transport system permease small subunit
MNLAKTESRVITAGLLVASIAVLTMMVIGAGDAFSTFFGYPIPGALEIAELLMVLVVFLALPDVEALRKHIVIDIVSSRFPASFSRPLAIFSALMSLGFYGAMAWQAWRLFADSWKIREQTAGLVKIPVYPTKALFAIALTVVTAIALRHLVQLMAGKAGASRVESNVEL